MNDRQNTWLVYHRNEPDFASMSGESILSEFLAGTGLDSAAARRPNPEMLEKGYELVAEVRCNDIEEVFALTNDGSNGPDWTVNEEVSILTRNPLRDTSVGDVVVDPKGIAHHCESQGWYELGAVMERDRSDDFEQEL